MFDVGKWRVCLRCPTGTGKNSSGNTGHRWLLLSSSWTPALSVREVVLIFACLAALSFACRKTKINKILSPAQAVSYSTYICQKTPALARDWVGIAQGFCLLGHGGCCWNSQLWKLLGFTGSRVWQGTVPLWPGEGRELLAGGWEMVPVRLKK